MKICSKKMKIIMGTILGLLIGCESNVDDSTQESIDSGRQVTDASEHQGSPDLYIPSIDSSILDVSLVDILLVDQDLMDSNPIEVDAFHLDQGFVDSGLIEPDISMIEMDASVSDVNVQDVEILVDSSTPPPPSNIFAVLNFDLIGGASLRVPFSLDDFEELVEFWVIREYRGITSILNLANEATVMTVNQEAFNYPEIGAVYDPLPPGDYALYLENFGDNSFGDFVAVKAIRSTRPYYESMGMILVDSVVAEVEFLDVGDGRATRFTVRPDHKYVLTGLRGRCFIFVIAAEEIAAIENGEPFHALYTWGEESDLFEPNPTELDLLPGDYAVVYGNFFEDGLNHGVAVRIDEWQTR